MILDSTSNIHESRIKMLVYSASGKGKTYLARTLPDHSRVLIVSAEGGLLTLKGCNFAVADVATRKVEENGQIKTVSIAKENRIERLGEIYKWLLEEEQMKKYDHIFIDSLTELAQNIYERALAKQNADVAAGKKKDGYQLWGDYANSFSSLIKTFRDIPHYNVIFTCLESLEKDESGRRFYTPEVPGNAAKALIVPAFDIVFRLVSHPEGRPQPLFVTRASESAAAKARGVELAPLEDADLGKIMDKIRAQIAG